MSKITYGIKNLHYAKKTIGSEGAITYAKPVAMPGASEMSLEPSGENTPIWADDSKYVVVSSNQGYEGSITVYGLPESFCTDILGMTKDEKGVLLENADALQAEFALLGEFSSESADKKRWVMYNCTAGRPSIAGKTKEESVEAQTYEIDITASPREDTGDVKASIVGTDADAIFKAWFQAVYEPGTEE